MAKYIVTSPTGENFEVTAPDSATEAEVMAYAQKSFGGKPEAPAATPQGLERSPANYIKAGADGFAQQTKDLLGGAVRGAGSIGATLLAPQDALESWLARNFHGKELPALDRREAMTSALRELGANPESFTFQAGKLGTEIAGTAGVGPAMAAAVPSRVAAAVPGLVNALQSAGMTTGGRAPGALNLLKDLGVRSLAGGAVGGASTAMIDPDSSGAGAAVGAALPPGLAAAGAVGKGTGSILAHAFGMATGVGSEPIKQAVKAGATGNKDFLANMRGEVPLTDVLERAKQGLQAMRAAKSAEYRAGMIPVQNDKTVLSFAGIDKALQDASAMTAFKGQVKNQAAASKVKEMADAVAEWKALDPAQFHTPEGLDALKQKLGAILEEVPYSQSSVRLAAGKVYNAAKSEIAAQAPTYSAVMKGYVEAAEQIKELERALSLGKGAAKDTAMRKLQSLMRNNVQTNYGNRLDLAKSLEQGGGVEILPSIAGQALNSWTPRSLAGQMGSGATVLGATMTANPLALGLLPLQSPRVIGSAAYGIGKMGGAGENALNAALGMGAAAPALTADELAQFLYRSAPVGLAVGQ